MLRYKLTGRTDTKLALVKTIKEITGLGLKESKGIVDELHEKGSSYFDSNYNMIVIKNIIDRYGIRGINISNRVDKISKFLEECEPITKDISVYKTIQGINLVNSEKETISMNQDDPLIIIEDEVYAKNIKEEEFQKIIISKEFVEINDNFFQKLY
jgi:hypothetical protein